MPSIKAALSASAIALMASAANAHMVMVTPPPYGTPDNSPIDAAGANFPCKATSNSGGTVTNMAIGSQQQLVFKGEAVHGGGSCQVSLTTDNPATKQSQWMVIHSIIGGCPARDAAGNIGGDNNANEIDPDTYNYTIPDGITPGTYTLAWTWFNKIGNREMYMNCANVKITGGSGSTSSGNSTTPGKRDIYGNEIDDYVHPELAVRASSFPPMFVANIPTTDCETVDSENVLFPDPGASVESAAANPQASSNLPVAPTGPKCGPSGAAAPAATGASSAGSSPAAAGAASPAASPAASAASPDSQAVAGSAPAAGVTPAPSPAASAAAPDSQSAAAPAVVASPAATSAAAAPAAAPATGGSSSSGSTASTGTCTQPGQSICSPDGLQIGTCTMSNTVTWIPVAAGTKCVGGYMVAAKSKRSPKFAENYVRRAM